MAPVIPNAKLVPMVSQVIHDALTVHLVTTRLGLKRMYARSLLMDQKRLLTARNRRPAASINGQLEAWVSVKRASPALYASKKASLTTQERNAKRVSTATIAFKTRLDALKLPRAPQGHTTTRKVGQNVSHVHLQSTASSQLQILHPLIVSKDTTVQKALK
jgi:hypothetical protein